MNFENLIPLIVASSAVFVYYDATSNNIGKVRKIKKFNNNSAGMWALGTLVLWIVIFPYYLFSRDRLKRRAKKYPVNTNLVLLKMLPLLAIVFFAYEASKQSAAQRTANYNNSSVPKPNKGISTSSDITIPDFIVDWDSYAGKAVKVKGLLISNSAELAYMYTESLGSGTPISLTRVGKSKLRYILKNCGASGCKTSLYLTPTVIFGSKGGLALSDNDAISLNKEQNKVSEERRVPAQNNSVTEKHEEKVKLVAAHIFSKLLKVQSDFDTNPTCLKSIGVDFQYIENQLRGTSFTVGFLEHNQNQIKWYKENGGSSNCGKDDDFIARKGNLDIKSFRADLISSNPTGYNNVGKATDLKFSLVIGRLVNVKGASNYDVWTIDENKNIVHLINPFQ